MQVRSPRTSRLVESLECRLLLSAAATAVSSGLTPAQLARLHGAGLHLISPTEKSIRQNPLSIVSSDLAGLYSQDPTGASLTAAQFGSIETQGGDPAVAVHARATASTRRLYHRLEKLGFSALSVLPAHHVVDGYLPVSSLTLAAILPGVSGITAIDKPTVNSVGSAPNQADQAMDAQLARSVYGLTGAGVKVGVISDSVNQVDGGLAASVASGDLPNNVTVLHDGTQNDTDEGRAMLEEIHDLAPGAALYFYNDGGDQKSMVNAINGLKAAGCKIIVDDVTYLDEPYFQDGVISRAINSFVASGGSYFSSAGNDSTNGYLRTAVQYTTDSSNNTWVNFAPKGATDKSLEFTLDGSVTLSLQWDNPYDGITGNATSDLNLLIYNYNGTKEVAHSTTNTLSNGIPEQTLHLTPGTYQMRIQLAGLAPGALPPDMIKFITNADYSGGLAYVNYPGVMGSAFGHDAGQNTISVGAVAFSNAPPFSIATPIQSENFSSAGPVVYAFDANGQRLASPLTLNKPDVSGVDGVNTSFFGYIDITDPTNFPQFFGTSASAPNVAAIAALIDQLKPGTSEATLLSALRYSATPLNGAAAGAWNAQGGYGLVDAVKALAYFGNAPVAPVAKLAAITSPRTTSVASESIAFNEAVTGFSLNNLELTRDGGANLLTSAQTLTATNSAAYTLGNLAALTAIPGTYTLTLTAFGSGIVGNGLPLASDAAVSWTTTGTTTATAPTVKLATITSPRTTSVSTEAITFNEAVAGFTLADLTLARNGGPNLLTAAQVLSTTDHKTFTLSDLSALTTPAAGYVLTLNTSASPIVGGGLPLANGATVSWHRNAAVAGRYLFYNDSAFNHYSVAPTSADDAAIATDKSALLPGHTGTFANYSSFYEGLNGIMIDVSGLPGSLTAADFIFKTGNSNLTSTWTTGPKPSAIAVWPGAGVGGSTRIVLVWPNANAKNPAAAVAGKWLQVTLKADSNTGLAAADVFYFGSAIGSTGINPKSAAVTPSDVAAIVAHESNTRVPITSDWDINRTGFVAGEDALLATAAETSSATALQLITPH